MPPRTRRCNGCFCIWSLGISKRRPHQCRPPRPTRHEIILGRPLHHLPEARRPAWCRRRSSRHGSRCTQFVRLRKSIKTSLALLCAMHLPAPPMPAACCRCLTVHCAGFRPLLIDVCLPPVPRDLALQEPSCVVFPVLCCSVFAFLELVWGHCRAGIYSGPTDTTNPIDGAIPSASPLFVEWANGIDASDTHFALAAARLFPPPASIASAISVRRISPTASRPATSR